MKKSSIVELWRLVATFAILLHHSYVVSAPNPSTPFQIAWVYVEFFLILTGFFTMAHFSKLPKKDLNEIAKDSFLYTWKKFSRILPYSAITILFTFIVDCLSNNVGALEVQGAILEALLLRAAIHGEYISNIPLWYLSTMLVIFPAFCCLCQVKAKNILYVVAGVLCVFFYGYKPLLPNTIAPLSFVRTFAGLLLGVLAYGIAEVFSKASFSPQSKVALTVVELFCLFSSVVMSWFNVGTIYLYLLFFLCGSSIMLSGISYTAMLKSTALCKVSNFVLSVYTWQWFVGSRGIGIITHYLSLEERYHVPVYICTTLLLALFTCVCYKLIRIVFDRQLVHSKKPI